MKILTLNTGSSSLKGAVFSLSEDDHRNATRLATVRLSGIGKNPELKIQDASNREREGEARASDMREALQAALPPLLKASEVDTPDAIGLRVVHSGPEIHSHSPIDEGIRAQLKEARDRAPLHNGPALEVLGGAENHFAREVPAVAVFDTVFFESLPEVEKTLPIPADVAQRHGFRRHGFHGLAHESLLESYHACPTSSHEDAVVSLQLGSGCSIAAFLGRKPIYQSMGFTPVSGPMMATRSGSIDPSLPLYLAKHENMTPDAVEKWLNTECGLQGISGVGSKMGDIVEARDRGSAGARLAFDLFVHQIRQHVGAAIASSGKPAAILFGGGVGENVPDVREAVCVPFNWMGLRFDSETNSASERGSSCLSRADSDISVHCFEVDEEILIARHTASALST